MGRLLGGWNMSLTGHPLNEFDHIMYGMVTNLPDLTTGSAANPGWSPERSSKPNNNPNFTGKGLWTYGGAGCAPEARPANMDEVSKIVSATINKNWDGVDFDDECNMNIGFVIETMKKLKLYNKETSFSFNAGYDYNHPDNAAGKNLNNKVEAIIESGYCDRLVHLCYAGAMWNDSDITNNVKQALERSISHGMPQNKIILALTSAGLTNWNLNYFLDQVINLNLGGLFIWAYDNINPNYLTVIKSRLNK